MSITLNQLFRSHMVLQADKPIRIFGRGEGRVEVSFLGETACTQASGEWLIELSAHPAGGPYEMELLLDGEKTILTDILLGDVYLLSGQSNMEFKLKESDVETAIYEDQENIRFFCCERLDNDGDFFHPADGWMPCTRENAPHFSAIGYFTGNMLYKKQQRPLGFVSCYQGASVIQSFISPATLEQIESVLPEDQKLKNRPLVGNYVWNNPNALYNFALKDLFPMQMKAAFWYQGESNANAIDAPMYDQLLRGMIEDWRRDFMQPDLHMIVVQIADYDARRDETWRMIQDMQLRAGEWDNVDTVICRDICSTNNIHPPVKSGLSRRIAELLSK